MSCVHSGVPFWLRVWLVLVFGLCLAPISHGQHVLVALDGNQARPVLAYRQATPLVERDGELQPASPARLEFRPAAAFGPGLVNVELLEVRSPAVEVVRPFTPLSYDIVLDMRLGSETALKQCYLVLEITSGKNRGLIGLELPDIEPGRDAVLVRRVPMRGPLDPQELLLHVFSAGLERLHSRLPADEIGAQQAKIEEFLLRDVADRPLAPAHVVTPDYPADLLAERLPGTAKVRCRVDKRGTVIESGLVSASHAAFGDAALRAVRQWTFEPAVRGHRYVASSVVVPFEFTPPVAPEESGQSP